MKSFPVTFHGVTDCRLHRHRSHRNSIHSNMCICVNFEYEYMCVMMMCGGCILALGCLRMWVGGGGGVCVFVRRKPHTIWNCKYFVDFLLSCWFNSWIFCSKYFLLTKQFFNVDASPQNTGALCGCMSTCDISKIVIIFHRFGSPQ